MRRFELSRQGLCYRFRFGFTGKIRANSRQVPRAVRTARFQGKLQNVMVGEYAQKNQANSDRNKMRNKQAQDAA